MALQACLSPEVVREYPRVRVGLWLSTTDTSDYGFSYSHVANQVDGYVTEMEKCGQSASQMGTRAVATSPYSTRLRPLSDLAEVFNAESGVLLESVEFVGYDATLGGSAHQNAANNTTIDSSQSSTLDAYMASHFRGGIMGNHQPNYCRPTILVNGIAVFDLGDSSVQELTTGRRGHLGDLSIGIPLPFGVDYYREFEHVTSIEVYGGLAQWISTSAEPTDKLVRYPLLCMMRWRMR
ncbi:MAG: hypothetical protein FGM24_09875 [Candidatus Kapabacteria bacterium]|nr:hypothetical protein [Candidatus Kapabacteria bacterium]